MTSTREEKKRKTKKAILSAAMELFGKHGYEKTSISLLARTAGVGKGTVYGYFSTKEEIFNAFCEDELEFIHEQLAQKTNPDAPVLEQMVTIFMAEFEYVTKNPEFGRIYMHNIIFPHQKDMELHKDTENKYFEMIFPILERAQQRGELRKELEVLHICGHFFATFLLLLHAWYSNIIPTEEAEESMYTLFTQIFEGLRPQTLSPK